MKHLFLDCPVARALWTQSDLDHLGEGLPRHTFPLFLKKLLAILQQPSQFMGVIAILWKIWRSRNWVVFEGKQFGILALMRQYHQQVGEWLSLPNDPRRPSLSPPSTSTVGLGGTGGLCVVGMEQFVQGLTLREALCSLMREGRPFGMLVFSSLGWMTQWWRKYLPFVKQSAGV
ncbi:unnamed protein product [Linum trigynum]|uniref:Reverse transcriptase zinc-binding domain-containing protein n=1 Tax=Linum trigynum TaxID=586398 RepID=A0AAV2DS31_9ROSI